MQEIIDIKCGGRHSLLLTNNGLVFATGNNYHGQLGINNKENQFEF
jgi:alpha-tubulin suppressor-like RCC1 family protein